MSIALPLPGEVPSLGSPTMGSGEKTVAFLPASNTNGATKTLTIIIITNKITLIDLSTFFIFSPPFLHSYSAIPRLGVHFIVANFSFLSLIILMLKVF
jgi:hypothetical protein